VPRERRDEAKEREEVAHAGARDEHDMRAGAAFPRLFVAGVAMAESLVDVRW
jgi:hypothetical protein